MPGKRFSLDKLPELLKNPPHDKEIMLYDKKKKGQGHHVNKSKKNKLTLSQRMDRLEITITDLAKIVSDGFSELRQDIKDINTRIDKIDARLDYIVEANNLKDNK